MTKTIDVVSTDGAIAYAEASLNDMELPEVTRMAMSTLASRTRQLLEDSEAGWGLAARRETELVELEKQLELRPVATPVTHPQTETNGFLLTFESRPERNGIYVRPAVAEQEFVCGPFASAPT
jgi:hypothetical protein